MCPHEEKLTAWLLGDLPPEEQEAMTRHLETCDSCRSAQEELSRVLTPLRRGLEKDRRWESLPAGTAAPRCRDYPASETESPARTSRWSWLWSPNEGLKRVAVLTLFFGTFLGMIGVVYQSLHPAPTSSSGITYISYLQNQAEPAPALAPEPEAKSDAAGPSRLVAAAELAEPKAAPSAPAAIPAPPEPARQAPALPTIADAEPAQEAIRKSFAAAPPRPAPAAEAPAAAAAPAKAAKRARAKEEAVVRRPPVAPLAKPVQLAGAVAPTNAAPTNAVLTNAASPKALNKP